MPNEVTIKVKAINGTKPVFDAVKAEAKKAGEDVAVNITATSTLRMEQDARGNKYRRAGEAIGDSIGESAGGRISERISETIRRDVNGRLRDSRGRFVGGSGSGGTTREKVVVDVDIDKPSFLSRLLDTMKGAGSRAGSVFSSAFGGVLSAALGGGGEIGNIVRIGLVALLGGPAIVTAGSAAGSAIVAGVLGVLGLGGIGLGIAGALKDPQIKGAAKQLQEEFTQIFSGYGNLFRRPLADFMESIMRDLIPQLKPMINELGETLAPLTTELGKGLIGFLQNVLPPILRAMRDSGPIIQTLAEKLPGLGDDIGVFFEHIRKSGPAASLFFEDLIELVGELIKGFGATIAAFTNMYLGMRTIGFTIVDFFAFVAQEILTAFEAAFGWIPGLSGKFKAAQQKVANFRKEVNEEINRIPKNRTFTLTIRQVFTQVGQAAVQIGNLLANEHGGIVGSAATGGARGGLTLVGEHGPELARLAPGSQVHSNPDTMRMLSGGGDRGGPLIVQLKLDTQVVAEVLIDPQRKIINQLFGGSVQAALGS